MLLTVLGCYGPYPRQGGACSGYLLENGGTRVLLECGAGVFARLIEYVRPEALDAVVLSHLHYDHCSDLFVTRYALDQQPVLPGGTKRAVPLYAPGEPEEVFRSLTRSPLLEGRPVSVGQTVKIGSLTFRFFPAAHPVRTLGMRITDDGGKTLYYTGDTGPLEGLAEAARGADALLADVCFVGDGPGNAAPHLTARQAGALAKAAGVKALYCTHLWGKFDTAETIKKEVDFSGAFVVKERGQYRI